MLSNQSKKFIKINVPNCVACKYFDKGKCNKYEHKVNKNINYITEKKASYIVARKNNSMCGMNGKGFESNIKDEIKNCNINIFFNISNSSCLTYGLFELIKIAEINSNLTYIYFFIGLYNSFFIYDTFKFFNKKNQLKKIPKEIEILIYNK